MNTPSPMSPENVSSLIGHLLRDKDPATVGIRKIIRRKEEQAQEFPLRSMETEEFDTPGKSKALNEDDKHILELEKKVADFEILLKKHQISARNAVQVAYTKGHQEGLKEGVESGKQTAMAEYEKRLSIVQEQLNEYIKSFDDSKHAIFLNAEHLVVKFSYEMAKKIVATELTLNNDVVLSTIKRALMHIGDRERLLIRVSPEDLDTASGRKDFWVPLSERLKDIIIEPDPRIEKGGCIIESNSGVIDARMGVQFDELADLIEKVWENNNGSHDSENDE